MVSVRVEEIKLCWSKSLRAFLFIHIQCFRKSLQQAIQKTSSAEKCIWLTAIVFRSQGRHSTLLIQELQLFV